MTRRREDDGFVGGFEGLAFGFLVFLAGTLLVSYAWAVVDTHSATTEAARQAARTYVEAPDQAQATADADRAAAEALSGYGRDPARARVTLAAGGFARCGRITVSVSYPAPLLDLPFVGLLGRGTVVRSSHSELVDPYRSGLAGVASCA